MLFISFFGQLILSEKASETGGAMDMDATDEELDKKLESFDQQILHEAKGNIPLQVCSNENKANVLYIKFDF